MANRNLDDLETVDAAEGSAPRAPEAPPPRRFGRTFWILNTIEMGERLAFYNLRVMAPIYIMQADNPAVAGILCFSVGEMTTGPKKNEYLGLIAPPGKKGLYLGYVNIPVGVGVYAGSKLAGWVYGHHGEKAVLALRYLAEKTPFGEGKAWGGDVGTLEAALGVKRTQAMARLSEVTGLDPVAATRLLWDTYSPQLAVWIPFACVGVVSALALWVFGRMARRWSDMDA